MNIIEAIKSGLKFRRLKDPEWWGDPKFDCIGVKITNMLATDWEVLVCEKHDETSSRQSSKYICSKCDAMIMMNLGKVKNSWKTLQEVAEEVAVMKNCAVGDCFPFEIMHEGNQAYLKQNEYLVVGYDEDMSFKTADGQGCWVNDENQEYNLADPCMWSVNSLEVQSGGETHYIKDSEQTTGWCHYKNSSGKSAVPITASEFVGEAKLNFCYLCGKDGHSSWCPRG